MNVRSWQNIRVIRMRNVRILTDLLDAHAEKGIAVMVIRAQVGFCPEMNFLHTSLSYWCCYCPSSEH